MEAKREPRSMEAVDDEAELVRHESDLKRLDYALEMFKVERQTQLDSATTVTTQLRGVFEKQASALRARRGAAVSGGSLRPCMCSSPEGDSGLGFQLVLAVGSHGGRWKRRCLQPSPMRPGDTMPC
jgi:hypothetical protein